MIELRCPGCGLANALKRAAMLDEARCAECESQLDEHLRIRYFVDDGKQAHRPQVRRDLLKRVTLGTLTPDMLLSEEGGPWFRAGERVDLFPPVRAPALQAPRRTSAVQPSPPGSVATMIVLDYLVAVLLLTIAVLAFAILASMGALEYGLIPILIFGSLGWGHIAMAKGLGRRSKSTRTVQLGLAGLVGLVLLAASLTGGGTSIPLIGALFVAIPYLLLLSAESRAWFDSEGTGA